MHHTVFNVREQSPFAHPTESTHLFQGLLESKEDLKPTNFPPQFSPKNSLKHSWNNIDFYQF